jgi:phospholipase/lecithinase/hemolysin
MYPRVAFIAAVLTVPCSVAFALPINTFNQIIAFGDSLSDPGNASFLTAGTEPGPNYASRTVGPFTLRYLTDGPGTTPGTGAGPTGLWIDQLASKMMLSDPGPALVPGFGGTNYAVAAAQTGSSNPTDMQYQVNLFLTQHAGSAPAGALYTFWGGSNDIFQGNNPLQAADNISNEIKQVAAAGGKYFIWIDEPPLGDTPGAIVADQTAPGNSAAAVFNGEWQNDLYALNNMGIYVIGVDVSSLFNQILADPSAFGFTDVTDACSNNFAPFNTCTSASDPNTYLFWDDVHPTTQGHSLVADAVYGDLQAAPEPATFGLMLLAGCGIMALRRAYRNVPIRSDK